MSVGGPLLSYLLGEPEMDGFFFLPPVYEACRGVYRHGQDMGFFVGIDEPARGGEWVGR